MGLAACYPSLLCNSFAFPRVTPHTSYTPYTELLSSTHPLHVLPGWLRAASRTSGSGEMPASASAHSAIALPTAVARSFTSAPSAAVPAANLLLLLCSDSPEGGVLGEGLGELQVSSLALKLMA